MKKRVWHKGPPPHVGWWNASILCDPCAWRWWNGERWSKVAYCGESAKEAGVSAKLTGDNDYFIEWTDYYPENARVPRIDPRK